MVLNSLVLSLTSIRAWKASILTQFLVMGVPTFFNMLKGIVVGLFLTMALSKMSEHGGRDCGGGANQETGSDGLVWGISLVFRAFSYYCCSFLSSSSSCYSSA
ncbi:unnamed protein product [Sphagnum jensenii]|uniref:Uncharacterized protein n=1 Tax=Sphagnum jensenii TaxID=128206 RepID=A0ABP1AXR8_9BRYO